MVPYEARGHYEWQCQSNGLLGWFVQAKYASGASGFGAEVVIIVQTAGFTSWLLKARWSIKYMCMDIVLYIERGVMEQTFLNIHSICTQQQHQLTDSLPGVAKLTTIYEHFTV